MSAATTNGRTGAMPAMPGKGSGRRLKHINDILSAPLPIEADISLKAMLDKAENLFGLAKSSLTFDRPDYALEAYLHAYIILIKVIPMHKEYSPVKGGQTELKRRINSLTKAVSEKHEEYELVKERIIADNRLHQTQPKTPRQKSTTASQPASTTATPVNGKKEKPAVQPKPAALHGNAIHRGSVSGKAADVLTARWKKLGGPDASPAASPGQDPRILTHPLPPSTSPQSFAQPTSLPKMPDAIYSPARGTLTEEAAALPTSTPGLFSRTVTSPSVSKAGQAPKGDYFSGVQAPAAPKKTSFSIPEGDSITPNEVMDLQQKGVKILLIDVRDRDEFDEGHINSQYIMSLEPSVVLMDGATSDTVKERMIINPEAEVALWDRRDTFDVVVMYDDHSEKFPTYIKSPDGNPALLALHRIMTMLSVGQTVTPKLLVGGIHAWVDLLGDQCLVSTTVNPLPRSKGRPASRSISTRGPIKYSTQGLSSAEINKFRRQTDYVRSHSEFMQKFPEVSTEPVSMTQPKQDTDGMYGPPRPPVPQHRPPRPPSHAGIQDLPSSLARPAPTAAKVGTSGLHSVADASTGSKGFAADGSSSAGQRMTGLVNPGVWCFANSTVQALRMSPGFGRELASKDWQASWKIPRMPGEDADHPQLMARILANLLYWMNNGSFEMMKANTLMEYTGSLTRRDPLVDFSGRSQQDAQEFLAFLMDALGQETNTRRDRFDPNPAAPVMDAGKSVLQGAVEYWNTLSRGSHSIVDKYWSFLMANITTCLNCKTTTYRWEQTQMLIANVPSAPSTTLEECIKEPPEQISGFTCDKCGKGRDAQIERKMGRVPELLCIQLARFQYNQNSSSSMRKNLTPVTWDLNNINVEPRFLAQKQRIPAPNIGSDEHYQGPFNYECYAVVTHVGQSISSGHYYTYARTTTGSEPNAWYKLNDTHVSRVKQPASEIFSIRDTATPYMAFFRRKHSGSSSVGGHL